MLILAATSDALRVTTSAASTVHVHASYIDKAGATEKGGRKNTSITTATTTDVLSGPANGASRQVQALTIRNTAGAANTVTVILTDASLAMQLYSVTLGPGSQLLYAAGAGFTVQTQIDATAAPWSGQIIGCARNGDPSDMLYHMQRGGVLGPTPTNIGATVARCQLFRPDYSITPATLRWYGIGAVAGIYTAAIYRYSDLARVSDQWTLTTTANAWNSVAVGTSFSLTGGTLYFVAVSANTTGTTAGIGSVGTTVAAATGQIQAAPTALPGSLSSSYISAYLFQFAVTAGAMPTTAATLAAQGAWTGGMPAFWLDAA